MFRNIDMYNVIWEIATKKVVKQLRNHPMHLHYDIKKTASVYIARCIELPSIVVYGYTEEEIETELTNAVTAYITTLPDEAVVAKTKQIKQIEISV